MLGRWPLLLLQRRASNNSRGNGRRDDRATMTRRGLLASVLTLALLAPAALVTPGCGGGGGDDDQQPRGNTTVSGRVVYSEADNRGAATDATVTLIVNNRTVGTATPQADGSFSFTAPAPSTNAVIRITAPDIQGFAYSLQTLSRINLTAGISLGALQPGVPVNIGTIRIYSRNAPPPPPDFPQ